MGQTRPHFTLEQDQIISQNVAEKRCNCWKELAKILNRKSYQVRERYNKYLELPTNTKPWCLEEDENLMNLIIGPLCSKWTQMEAYFSGRNQILNRNGWNHIIRRTLLPIHVPIDSILQVQNAID
jgi:hypothetical protein